MKLEAQFNIKKLVAHPNIAEELSQKDLDAIAQQIYHEYQLDKESRSEWETRNAGSLELALQVTKEKSFPWPGCANVMFPLVTIAAMQCHAREYPALISGTELVKCRVIGEDPTGQKSARARRVASHMSYQIIEEDANWEDQMDRVMFTKPIVGSAFKKVYFDPVLGHNVSEAILAQDLVIPYHAKSLEKAARITHVIRLSKNDIYERVVRGSFLNALDVAQNQTIKEQSPLNQLSDDVQGRREIAGDDDAPVTVLEQHRYLDLDGDGYAEPYIVTITEETQQVLRIVARFFKNDIEMRGDKVAHITPQHFFVKYGMIPSPDGGIYDLGFGSLLGPLNRTTNTLINQLLDAGTLSNMGGGFLGRGVKLRKGQSSFAMGEWKQTDSQDLRGQVFPLPVKEPSNVLFMLLSMIINYGERISGATDIMSGENVGQNTPAATAQELVKQGSIIFNSIFKRTYRSLRDEFRMLYRLNQLYLESQKDFEDLSTGDAMMILAEDYLGKDTDIRPAADPNVVSVEKRMQQAVFLKQASMQGPGYKAIPIERRMLEAAGIPYISEVWDAETPAQPNVKLMMEQAKLEQEKLEFKGNMQYKMLDLMQQADKLRAEIANLEADTLLKKANAKGAIIGQQVNLMNTQIAAKKAQQDGIINSVKIIREILDSLAQQQGGNNSGLSMESNTGGDSGMAAPSSEQGGEAGLEASSGTVEE